jgi:hypothetical protein
MTDEDSLDTINQVALELYEKYAADNIIVKTPQFTITVTRPIEQREIERHSFSEAYKYLKNAKRRFNTKTPEGYSNCKADCRNGLMSALKTLTGMNTIKEAATELHRQGILGKREEEFYKTFGNLLVILHGIDSKKGSHPPMERNEDDAELALNITRDIIEYIISQATLPRD